jgi:hypothetical protein
MKRYINIILVFVVAFICTRSLCNAQNNSSIGIIGPEELGFYMDDKLRVWGYIQVKNNSDSSIWLRADADKAQVVDAIGGIHAYIPAHRSGLIRYNRSLGRYYNQQLKMLKTTPLEIKFPIYIKSDTNVFMKHLLWYTDTSQVNDFDPMWNKYFANKLVGLKIPIREDIQIISTDTFGFGMNIRNETTIIVGVMKIKNISSHPIKMVGFYADKKNDTLKSGEYGEHECIIPAGKSAVFFYKKKDCNKQHQDPLSDSTNPPSFTFRLLFSDGNKKKSIPFEIFFTQQNLYQIPAYK